MLSIRTQQPWRQTLEEQHQAHRMILGTQIITLLLLDLPEVEGFPREHAAPQHLDLPEVEGYPRGRAPQISLLLRQILTRNAHRHMQGHVEGVEEKVVAKGKFLVPRQWEAIPQGQLEWAA